MMGRSRPARAAVARTSELAPMPPRATPIAMQAAATLLRPGLTGTPVDYDSEWQRFAKCVTCRPKATARAVVEQAKRKAMSLTVSHPAVSSFRSSSRAKSLALPREVRSDEGITSSSQINGTAWGLYTTVEELREAYGEGRTLSAVETRELYHSLLPTQLLEHGDQSTLPERAQLAIKARHAARLYARERAKLPVTISSELMDGVRTFMKQGRFQKAGLSEEQIWQKYAGCSSPHEVHDDEIYRTILQKACTSNQHVDKLCLRLASSAAGWTVGGLASGITAAAASTLGRSMQDAGI